LETLRYIREQAGLSQPELSELSGVAQGTISDIERGKRKPRGRTLRKLAQVLGVEVADLLGESETLKVQPPLLEFPEERREDVYEVVLNAARSQAEHDRQAANRTLASEGIPQPAYFKNYENEAIHRLLGYPPDELAGALMELAGQLARLEQAHKVQSEATYEPWRESINCYANRWEQRIEAGDFNMADVNEFIATLEDLGPTLNRLGLQEKREQPTGYESSFGPIMGEAIGRLMDLLNPLIEAGVAKFDNSEIEQLRRKRAEQEAALGEPVRRGA
jgi:transcriptional regulator with XRE-family HTH domain